MITLSYKKFKAFAQHKKTRIIQDLTLPSEKLVETVAIQPVAAVNNAKNYVLAVEFDNFQYPDDHRKTIVEAFPDFDFSDIDAIPDLKYSFLMLVSWKLWEDMINAAFNERISALGVSLSKVSERLTVPVLLDIGKKIAATDYAVIYYKIKQHPKFYHNKEALIGSVRRGYENCAVDRKVQIIDILESQGLLQPIKEAIKGKEEHERQKQLRVVKKMARSLTQIQGVGKNGKIL